MDSISKIALGGIQKASEKIAQSSNKIAEGSDLGNPEPFIEVAQAKTEFQASAKVAQVDKNLQKSVLDILA